MEVHHNGVRAEFARIVAIAPTHATNVSLVHTLDLAKCSEVYGVPVVALSQLESIGLEHGSRLPTSVIPEKPEPEESQPTVYPYRLGMPLMVGTPTVGWVTTTTSTSWSPPIYQYKPEHKPEPQGSKKKKKSPKLRRPREQFTRVHERPNAAFKDKR
jgi:hypothetical protein